jgi:hypothetical protein
MGDAVLLKSVDALPAVLSHLSLPERCRAASVSLAWRQASSVSLAGLCEVDLRPYAGSATDATLAVLCARCHQLRILTVSGCAQITDAGLARVEGCGALVELNLACLPRITEEGVARVVDGLAERLVTLDLAGCTAISARAMQGRFGRFLELEEDDDDGLGACQG